MPSMTMNERMKCRILEQSNETFWYVGRKIEYCNFLRLHVHGKFVTYCHGCRS